VEKERKRRMYSAEYRLKRCSCSSAAAKASGRCLGAGDWRNRGAALGDEVGHLQSFPSYAFFQL